MIKNAEINLMLFNFAHWCYEFTEKDFFNNPTS